MTTTKDCLNDAINAYKGTFEKEDIKDLFDKVKSVHTFAQKQGLDINETLDDMLKNEFDNHENRILAQKLRIVKTIEHQANNLQLVLKWHDAKFDKSPWKAMMSRLTGTPYKMVGARDNIDTRMNYSRVKFNTDLQNFLHDNNLLKFYNSFANQEGIAQKLLDEQNGISDTESPEGKIANFFHQKSERLINGFEKEGILTPKLRTRIFGTIHDSDKMTHIPLPVRIKESFNEASRNEWIYNRWKSVIRPLLDDEKTFVENGVDPDDDTKTDRFLRNVFTKLINRDSPLSKKLNLVERYDTSRKLHFNSAESVVKYNTEFGRGSIQDSLSNELGNGFSTLALVQQFGAEPMDTLTGTYQDLDKVEIDGKQVFKHREGKGKELIKLQKVMSGLMNGTSRSIPGLLGNVVNGLKAYVMANNLGLTMLKSIPDMASLGNEAKRLNMSQFEAFGTALQALTTGLSHEDKQLMADVFDVFRRTHNGVIAQMFPNEFGSASISAQAVKLMSTLNGLQRWDYAMQVATQSLLGRWFALNKDVSFDHLTEQDKTNLAMYGLDKIHYEAIRQSGQTAVGAKKLIMPDSIQYLDHESVRQIMRVNGEKNLSDRSVEKFKNEVEDKMRTYFNDRMDHVIQRGDVVDRQLLSYMGDNRMLNGLAKLIAQFKMFGLSFLRKNLREVLYGKGARNLNEALWGGRANYYGMSQMVTKLMAFTYIGNSLANFWQGYKPPDLENLNTWPTLIQDSLGGIIASGLKFDLSDPAKSLGEFVFGSPFLEDFGHLANLTKQTAKATVGMTPWKNSQKAFFGMVHNFHPFVNTPYTNWLYNNLTGYNFYEMAHGPGSLRRFYQQQAKQGRNRI